MNKNKVINNFIWRFLERCGAQCVTFIVSIVLARILDPKVYGTVALVTVFTTIMQVFVDSGMGNALIQKKNADDLDFSSVFYFNIIMCTMLYLVMFFSAPFISSFYNMPELTPVVRVLSLTLIISGVKNVQQAYVSRTMQFKKFFFATLGGTIGAAIVGITLAYSGFGVWALVAQSLFNAIVDTIILWITVKWKPKRMFSMKRLKGLFSFGWKMLASSLLETVYNEIRQLIIGKIYTSNDLAYYNQGQKFPSVITSNINSSIDSVLLPTMSKEQDNKTRVKSMTRRAIKTSTYIMMPLMIGLAVCAKPIVSLVLTDKWLPCVTFLRIFCFTYAFWPIHTANLNAIKALGRSDIFLKLEIIKKVIGIIAILSTMYISVEAMAYSMLITSILSQIINSWPNKKLLNYSYIEQLKDMLPQICLSLFMGTIVYFIQFIKLSNVITLILQIIIGACIYVLGSRVFHIDSYEYVSSTIKDMFKKSKK
jgi:O-antigen/teichoic acid export membrane protein